MNTRAFKNIILSIISDYSVLQKTKQKNFNVDLLSRKISILFFLIFFVYSLLEFWSALWLLRYLLWPVNHTMLFMVNTAIKEFNSMLTKFLCGYCWAERNLEWLIQHKFRTNGFYYTRNQNIHQRWFSPKLYLLLARGKFVVVLARKSCDVFVFTLSCFLVKFVS